MFLQNYIHITFNIFYLENFSETFSVGFFSDRHPQNAGYMLTNELIEFSSFSLKGYDSLSYVHF